MPIALHSYKIDDDGEIRVRHTFYAASEEEADELMGQHAAGCQAFGPAVAAEKTIDIYEEIDEEDLPDAETLEEFGEAVDEEEDDEEVASD